MGGFGSGRCGGPDHDTVEACRLHEPAASRRQPAQGSEERLPMDAARELVASINLRAESDRLYLAYRVRVITRLVDRQENGRDA
jgi:hypothetical protein